MSCGSRWHCCGRRWEWRKSTLRAGWADEIIKTSCCLGPYGRFVSAPLASGTAVRRQPTEQIPTLFCNIINLLTECKFWFWQGRLGSNQNRPQRIRGLQTNIVARVFLRKWKITSENVLKGAFWAILLSSLIWSQNQIKSNTPNIHLLLIYLILIKL